MLYLFDGALASFQANIISKVNASHPTLTERAADLITIS
jgi:hypothetical protein